MPRRSRSTGRCTVEVSPRRLCNSCGRHLSDHLRSVLRSARLLPCDRRQRRQVVEGTHRIIAEGTGPQPYGPGQGLIGGQGGLQDVDARVDLPIHLPIAHPADEILAYPISAPGATRWAGLGRPLGIDPDDEHAGEGGLVLDLTIDFGTGPGAEAAVHLLRLPSGPVQGEVLQDDRGPGVLGKPDEPFRDPMQSLPHPITFALTFAVEESPGDPAVARLLPGELSTPGEMDRLDLADAAQ